MLIVGSIFVGLNIILFAGRAWQGYQTQSTPLMAIGLWSLGVINMLSGLSALWMDYSLGIIAIISGALSAEIGWLVADYWQKESGPNWNWHALYIASSVFFIGLLAIA